MINQLKNKIFGNDKEYTFKHLDESMLPKTGWQNTLTKEQLCKKMVALEKETIFKKGKHILVLFNVHILKIILYLIDEKEYINYYFIADSEEKYNMIHKYFPKVHIAFLNKIEKDDNGKEISGWNENILIKKIKKEFNMKSFDVVLSNPPYEEIDLKILNMLIENKMFKKAVFIHPGNWLFNRKNYLTLKNTNKLEEVIFFWGNKEFDKTEIKHAHCISVWNMDKTDSTIHVIDKAFVERTDVYTKDVLKYDEDGEPYYDYYCDVNDVNIHSLVNKEATALYNKYINCDSILNHITLWTEVEKRTDFGVRFTTYRPGLDYETRNYGMFFSLCGNGVDAQTSMKVGKDLPLTDNVKKNYKNNLTLWYFATEEERTNFINYCKTKVVRFLLSLTKHNANVVSGSPTRIIPWMDFTKEWTDEKLIKEFGISEKLWNYIDKFILDYYDDEYRNNIRGNI